jgi:ketosteroid isomerase-like protein
MSANVDLVRSIYAAWERGDFSSADWAHPEIEFERVGEGPDAGSWKGVRGMARGWREFLGPWDDVRVEVEEFRELDAERVLLLASVSGRGKTSGLRVDHVSGATLFHIRDGKVTRLVLYWDRENALADLGLAE